MSSLINNTHFYKLLPGNTHSSDSPRSRRTSPATTDNRSPDPADSQQILDDNRRSPCDCPQCIAHSAHKPYPRKHPCTLAPQPRACTQPSPDNQHPLRTPPPVGSPHYTHRPPAHADTSTGRHPAHSCTWHPVRTVAAGTRQSARTGRAHRP